MGNRSKQGNQKAPVVRQASIPRRDFNDHALGKSLYCGYWVSMFSNFIPVGNWWVKLIVFALNLAALATLYGLGHWRK